MSKIGIIGTGTFGIALGRMLSNSGNEVTMWSSSFKHAMLLAENRFHENLPGIFIPFNIRFTTDMKTVCDNKDIILFVIPSLYVRETARKAAPFIGEGQIVVSAVKGIEKETLMNMTSVIEDEIKKKIRTVALSGPTHAEEVALDMPSTIVSASLDREAAEIVQDVCMNTCMRVYTNGDPVGVELCGALKNIIALASGISTGLGYGDNAKAAIMTRGMAEITRLGLKMGCDKNTFMGLAGIGDLIVTATSEHSRNNRAGKLIGQGRTAEEAIKEVGMVVEGLNALPAAMELAKKYGTELPICEAVYRIVNLNENPGKAVKQLMERPRRGE